MTTIALLIFVLSFVVLAAVDYVQHLVERKIDQLFVDYLGEDDSQITLFV